MKVISKAQLHRVLIIEIDGREIEVHFIKHTSSFFSWKKWNQYFQEINFFKSK